MKEEQEIRTLLGDASLRIGVNTTDYLLEVFAAQLPEFGIISRFRLVDTINPAGPPGGKIQTHRVQCYVPDSKPSPEWDKEFKDMIPALRYIKDEIIKSISDHFHKRFGKGFVFTQSEWSGIRYFLNDWIGEANLVTEEESHRRMKDIRMGFLRQALSQTKQRASELGLDISNLKNFERKYLKERG